MTRGPLLSDAIELWEFLAGRALGRVVLATGAVGAVGALLGAVSTAVAFLAFLLTADLTASGFGGPPLLALAFLVPVSLVVGAALGVVCGPLAGWLFLRRVPLWRSFLEPAAAVVLGAALCGPTGRLDAAVACAAGAYWVAAARLGWSHRNATTRLGAPLRQSLGSGMELHGG